MDTLHSFVAYWRDSFDVVFAGLVAIFTIVTGVVSYFQWRGLRVGQRLTLDALKIARVEASAATAAAKASKRSADIAEETLHKLEVPHVYPTELRYFSRAYLEPIAETRVGYVGHVADLQKTGYFVAAKLKNYGRAPAIMRDAHLKVIVAEASPSDPHKWLTKERHVRMTGMLGDRETSAEIEIGPIEKLEQFSALISKGEKRLLLMTKVNYDDVLGTNRATGTWYIWDWRSNAFVPGQQLHS